MRIEHWLKLLLAVTILSFTACKSDEQMEEDLVGTWKLGRCPSSANDDDTDEFWFYGNVTFGSDMSVQESAPWFFCKDTCESPASDPMRYCTCTYSVEDGHLIITPNGENPQGHLAYTNIPYLTGIPIKKVTDKRLVLDSQEVNGYKIECTCLDKQ